MPTARFDALVLPFLAPIIWLVIGAALIRGADAPAPYFDFEHLAAIRQVTDVEIAPDGARIAYLVSIPRTPGDGDDGPVRHALHVATRGDDGYQAGRAFVHGSVDVSAPRFSPDGQHVFFTTSRVAEAPASLWSIPVDGGEGVEVLAHPTGVGAYALSPDGARVAFLATEEEPEARKKAKELGYSEEVYEEDRSPNRVWIFDLPDREPSIPVPGESPQPNEPHALDVEGSVVSLRWMPNGESLALTVAPRPLIDDRYMLQRIVVVDAASGEVRGRIENPGKLGNVQPSPDGRHIAAISAADPNDPKEGRLLVAPSEGGPLRDLLPKLEGHVSAAAWRDAETLVYVADVGTETILAEVGLNGATASYLDSSTGESPVVVDLDLAADGRHAVLRGQTSSHPNEAFALTLGSKPRRLTDSNPWLHDVPLQTQRVVRFAARDGLVLEGILIEPADAEGPSPLVLAVHGGPESHDRNGWPTSYSRPGQLLAARGYAVFYPNYRGSTGRGVAFSKISQGDAAGAEFDDLVDAVDHLIEAGIADRERVGITGGSYGGYATAWCATYHTDRFRAGVMFVGISNKHSKAFTTDIPNEDRMVHTLFDPWAKPAYALERSPLSFVEQARTPLLIAGGTADTRVHPSQSLQLYRALSLVGQTPVRYVRYPGEPHGNQRAASRDDYSRRLVRWLDHFLLTDATEPPPWRLEHPALQEEEGEAAEEP